MAWALSGLRSSMPAQAPALADRLDEADLTLPSGCARRGTGRTVSATGKDECDNTTN